MIGLQRWSDRPFEERALFNPAFMAAVLHEAIDGYEGETDKGLPFALAFLVSPVALSSLFRNSLPTRKDSSLAAWLQNHPDLRLKLADIAVAMAPVVRDGILFGATKKVLQLDGAELKSGSFKRGTLSLVGQSTTEVQEILAKARFVGRWYANAGTVETIMVLWGVRP